MVYSALIVLAASRIQLTGSSGVTSLPKGALARRILIEPLRGNTHAAWVGDISVTNNGTGLAIKEIGVPVTGQPLDRWNHVVSGDMRSEDPSIYYVHGTTGEKLLATIWTA